MSKKNSKKKQTLTVPKLIIIIAKTLQFLSKKWATNFAIRIFTTPTKYKMPKREIEMDANSRQEQIKIPQINKSIAVYHYGNSHKKVLLVHGWSGRGTQLVKFAEELIAQGYSTISFDAPAHGKSNTNTTVMPEFIACILELERIHGPFEYAIGHSLGGMSLLNAVKNGLNIKKLVVIGSGDVISDITNFFTVHLLKLKPIIAQRMQEEFEKKFGVPMENYSAHEAAKQIKIPTLVIHDENDYEVPVSCGKNIFNNLSNGEIYLTTKLGHRKILGDKTVIKKTIDFITI